MNLSIIKNNIEEFLMEDIEHKNKGIDYILVNVKKNEYIAVASDGLEEMIEFAPYTKELLNGYSNIPEWDFNFDTYLFEHLENGYDIAYMEDDVHYGIWQTLNDLYPLDIESKEGVQKYLEYCYKNNITKEYLEDRLQFNYSNLNVPDIMKYYEKDYIQINNNQVVMSKETFNKIRGGNMNSLDLEKKDGTKHRLLENGMYIMDLGYRDDTPVALVQRTLQDINIEYIIAFNYQITNNKINWGYGYYYSTDLEKARTDFNKVLDGGNLADTFNVKKDDNKTKENRKRKSREAR